jgi:hypothetical protein
LPAAACHIANKIVTCCSSTASSATLRNKQPLLPSHHLLPPAVLLNRKCTCCFYTTAGPATLRITSGRRLFQPGAFKLGWWAYPLGVVSTCWWIFSLVVFSLPTEYPVTGDNFNSAPVTLGATLLLASLWYWVPGIGAKKRFNGPSFDVVAFERQLLLGEVEEGAAEYAKNVPRQSLT